MTLIECFDRSPVENLAACLRLRPEKLVFVGNAQLMRGSVARYRNFLKARGLRTRIEQYSVDAYDVGEITGLLAAIVNREGECVVDITGGEETVLVAVGAMLAQLEPQQRSRVSVQQFDLYSGKAVDCDGDGETEAGCNTTISVEELIYLHGGTIHPKQEQLPGEYRVGDIEQLWQIVRQEPKKWNDAIGALAEFEKRSLSDSQVYLLLDQISGEISNFHEKKARVVELKDTLREAGLVRDYSAGNVLRYEYVHSLTRYCTRKAGNLLEVKALLEARELLENGRPYFSDCLGAVSIDWDGQLHTRSENIADTRNEVDLILVRGMVPLFVSCKNGKIDDEELYKLHTVAQRFGSKYARKLLLATDLGQQSPAAVRAVEKRAEDMGIAIVTNAADLSRQGWKGVLKKAMEAV